MHYQQTLELDLDPDLIFSFFLNLETWFRLNPQWQVLSYQGEQPPREGGSFVLQVEYDRTEQVVDYRGLIVEFQPNRRLTVRLEGNGLREIQIEVNDARFISLLKYRELLEQPLSAPEHMELDLWLKSVVNYIQISHRRSSFSRVWKWFLDRYWLKMSPSGRRTVFFVVAAEGLSLLFFLLILLWFLLFKRL